MELGPVTASAPGKVLLVGGYLVLHRPHCALVAGASARFYVTAEWTAEGTDTGAAPGMVGVRVVSPQFHSDRVFRLAAEAPFAFSGDEPPSFIALALRTVLLAAGRAAPPALAAGRDSGRVLRLTLRADNDFYSQLPHLEAAATEVTADALRAVPPFQPPPTEAELARGDGTSAPAIRKTGLGSSAALTVALSAAVAALLGALPADAALPGQGGPPAVAAGPVSRAWLMRCGQVSHGLAQGKVGSGFDVSAAVLGTQLYQRVSRDVLAGAMSSVDAALAGGARDGAEAVLRGEAAPNGGAGAGARGGAGQFGPGWDLEVGPAGLPACVDLLLADVSGGSSTPSMVRKVEAWRASGAEAAARWEGVAEATAAAQRALRGLADAQGACGDAGSAAAALAFAATTTADAWAAGPGSGAPLPAEGMALLASLADASASLKAWRASMHAMGEAAGVPIEPESQTALLDATEALPGVIAAAVPGAGGFDAIYALCVRTPEARAAVEGCWMGFRGRIVVPLMLTAEPDDPVHGGVRLSRGHPL